MPEIIVDKPLKKFVTSEKICTFVTPTATETRFLSPTETPRFHFYLFNAVVAQLVEHQLPKLRVASSSLVYRSLRRDVPDIAPFSCPIPPLTSPISHAPSFAPPLPPHVATVPVIGRARPITQQKKFIQIKDWMNGTSGECGWPFVPSLFYRFIFSCGLEVS